jgi:hypothetical protein
MAKIAKLHNGSEVHFPDDMPDDRVDMAVAALHAPHPDDAPKPAAEKPAPKEISAPDPDVMEAVLGGLSKIKEKSKADAAATQTHAEGLHRENIKSRENGDTMKVSALEDIGMLLHQLKEELAPLATDRLGEKIDALNENVVNLGNIITESVNKMIEFAGRKRTIETDGAGVPKSIQISGNTPPSS